MLVALLGSALMLTNAWLAPAGARDAVTDVAGRVGLAEVTETFSAAARDYDKDGDLDVLISYHDHGGKLWRNDHGHFTQVAKDAFPMRNADGNIIDRHDCAWADVNRDGLPDAFCSVGRTHYDNVKTGVYPDNELWLQRPRGSFSDVGTAWGVGDPYGRGRDAVFLDANGDRWPDLYVGNEPPRAGDTAGEKWGASKLFLNRHGTGFVDAPDFGLDHFAGSCAVKGDLNGDGFKDLVTCSKDGVRIYRNKADHGFSDVTARSGLHVWNKQRVAKSDYYADVDLADLDGDGDRDFVAVRSDRLIYRLNDGRGHFSRQKTVQRLTGAREVAAGDADGDGDNDLFVVSTNSPGSSTNPDDSLFLNNKLRFSRWTAPSATGRGDRVIKFDYNGDGRDEFLVLNGANVPGPVQLLSWQ
ncbi:MAG: hypothetical protein QOK15_1011 [Nocardioidaceae bacterium]|jgi:hypothetical protein|nr:hypothetical protein [Nocardioidaceae bacterium]